MKLEDVQPQIHTLESGLRVLGLPLPNVHRVALWAHVRVGSRFETRRTNGLSHFLEHMLYRGTPTYPTAQKLAYAFEELGGSLVAETGADSGWMAVSVPPDAFEASLRIFAEVFQRPIFSAIETEKGIIVEELLEELDENGKLVDVDSLMRSQMFGDHPLGLPIGGDIRNIRRFDVAVLKAHHEAHYTARGTVVSVCGPIDVDRALRSVGEAFSALPPGSPLRPRAAEKPDGPHFHFVRHASSQTALRVAFRAPGTADELEPATELLLRLLDDGMSTRLYRQVCDEKGLCYDVSAHYEAYDDVGFFALSADAAHDRAEAVLSELFDVVRRVRDEGPTPGELDKVKARHHFQLTELLDAPEHLAEYHAEQLLTGDLQSLAQRRAALSAVTDAELQHAAARLFSKENLTAVAVGLPSRATRGRLEELVTSFR